MGADNSLFGGVSYQNGCGMSCARSSKKFVYEWGNWQMNINTHDKSVNDFAEKLFVGQGGPPLIVPLICGDLHVVGATLDTDRSCQGAYPRMEKLRNAQLILISGKSASKQALSQIADRLIGPEYNREHSRRYVYVDTEGILAVGSYSKTDPQVASRHTRHIGEGGPPHVYVALSATPEA